jgi:hypothetical protein
MMTQFTKFEIINWVTSYAVNLAIKVAFFCYSFDYTHKIIIENKGVCVYNQPFQGLDELIWKENH